MYRIIRGNLLQTVFELQSEGYSDFIFGPCESNFCLIFLLYPNLGGAISIASFGPYEDKLTDYIYISYFLSALFHL